MDCPECGKFNPLTAERCVCGYRFPDVSSVTTRRKVATEPSRIYKPKVLESVLKELEDKREPVAQLSRKTATPPARSDPPPNTGSEKAERISFALAVVVGALVVKYGFYALLAVAAIYGVFVAPVHTMAAVAVITFVIWYMRGRRK
jgi:hypothetical protein